MPYKSAVTGRAKRITCRHCFRFLLVVAVLGGLGYAAVFALANLVPLKPREITVTITPDKFLKQPR